MFCPRCGAENEKGSRYCASCGNELHKTFPTGDREPAKPGGFGAAFERMVGTNRRTRKAFARLVERLAEAADEAERREA